MEAFWVELFQRLAKEGIVSAFKQVTRGGRKDEIRPINEAESRFRRLLTDYEIVETQLPRIAPEDWKWTLGELTDTAGLMRKLTGKRLEWFAELFGVCPEWLEGTFDDSGHARCERIYNRIWLYKDIGRVQKHLERMKWSTNWPRMTVFVDDYFRKELNGSSRLGVVFTYDAPESTTLRIRRHIVCGDTWSWSYSPTRIQLKALARWFWMTYGTVVPLVPVKTDVLNSIVNGATLVESLVPFGTGCYDMFELYGLSHAEAVAARDEDEFPTVQKCFDSCFNAPPTLETI